MQNSNYHDQQNRHNITKLRQIINDLPEFTSEFFRGIEHKTSSQTRIAYAYDLRIFFRFLVCTVVSLGFLGLYLISDRRHFLTVGLKI